MSGRAKANRGARSRKEGQPTGGATRAVVQGGRYPVEVTGLDPNGDGVARYQGFVVFVDGAIPGDRAEVEVLEVSRRFARARLVSLVAPAEDRIEPACPLAGICGGCQLQPMDYGAQLAAKRRLVVEALERVGRLKGIPVHPTLGMEAPLGYRNKAQYPVRRVEGRVALGFFRRGSHEMVPLEECPVQHPTSTRLARAARRAFEELGLEPYDEATGSGLVRHLVTRVSFATGQVMAVVVTNGRELPRAGELVDRLREAVPDLVSVAQNIHTARTNVILGHETRLLWGVEAIEEQVGPIRLRISPLSFFQVNTRQAEHLYRTAVEAASLDGRQLVVDVYCGIGGIALTAALRAREVVGIEVVEAAVADARANARLNGIENARFEAGLAEEVVVRLAREWAEVGQGPGAVFLDPPRKGCEPQVLEAVASVRVPRVVYVSCNPATLARDLAILAGRGYRVVEVRPVDMFPFTAHVEAVARLERL